MLKKFLRTSLKLLGFAMTGFTFLLSQECSACWWWEETPIPPPISSREAMTGPLKDDCCGECCGWYYGFQIFNPDNFLQKYTDEQLREHTANCTGSFIHQVNFIEYGTVTYSPSYEKTCQVCKEMERRVLAGPCKDDLTIISRPSDQHYTTKYGNVHGVYPYKLDRIPQSSMLTVMPTSTSDKTFVDEYQSRRNLPRNRNNEEDIFI